MALEGLPTSPTMRESDVSPGPAATEIPLQTHIVDFSGVDLYMALLVVGGFGDMNVFLQRDGVSDRRVHADVGGVYWFVVGFE